MMYLACLQIHLRLSACSSLKEKRGVIKPIIARFQHQFGASAAEIAFQDKWKDCVIGSSLVSNNALHAQQIVQNMLADCETFWPNVTILSHQIDLIELPYEK